MKRPKNRVIVIEVDEDNTIGGVEFANQLYELNSYIDYLEEFIKKMIELKKQKND